MFYSRFVLSTLALCIASANAASFRLSAGGALALPQFNSGLVSLAVSVFLVQTVSAAPIPQDESTSVSITSTEEPAIEETSSLEEPTPAEETTTEVTTEEFTTPTSSSSTSSSTSLPTSSSSSTGVVIPIQTTGGGNGGTEQGCFWYGSCWGWK